MSNDVYQGFSELVKLIERREKDTVDGTFHSKLEETEVVLLDGTRVFGKQDAKVEETGGAVWDGALILAEFFAANPNVLLKEDGTQKKSVIDLGSGTGLLGAAVAKIQNRLLPESRSTVRVVVSDNAPNVPLMHATLVRNELCDECVSLEHAWGEPIPDDSPMKSLSPFDLILGTDLVYIPDSMPDLWASFRMLSGPQTQIYLAWNELFRYVDDHFLTTLSGSDFSIEYVFGPAPDAPTISNGPRIPPLRIVKLIRN